MDGWQYFPLSVLCFSLHYKAVAKIAITRENGIATSKSFHFTS